MREKNKLKMRGIIGGLIGIFLFLQLAAGAAEFSISSFSCTPSEAVINDVFSCTAQISNTGDATGSVSVATLYPDSGNWLEESNYPQASGSSVEPGQSTEVTFSGLRSTRSGNNGFTKIMLDDVTDTYVADNNIKENVIDVSVTVSNSASSAAVNATFDATAQITAGGNIDVTLTFTVDSGGCSIGSQDSSKTISGMQDGNKQSRSWTVTQGISGDCEYTISAAATGNSGTATKTDSSSSSVTCTNCPASSESSSATSGGGGGGGGGISGTVTYVIGELSADYAVELAKGEVATFNLSGTAHKVKVENMTETEANIAIQSEVQKFKLIIGDEKEVDLNNDSFADISVKLKSINLISKKAKLILSPLTGAGLLGEGETVGEAKKEDAGKEERSDKEVGKLLGARGTNWILIILIIVILILVVVYFIRRNNRRKAWGLRI